MNEWPMWVQVGMGYVVGRVAYEILKFLVELFFFQAARR